MRTPLAAALALAVMPLIAPSARCQEPAVGERLRVKTASSTVIGTLDTREPGYLVIQTATIQARIPWDSISRLQVSDGMRSNTLKGAIGGIAVSSALGGITYLVACPPADRDSGSESTFCENSSVGGWIGAFAIFGGLIGAGIGAANKSERWEDVPSDRWRIEVTPDLNGGVSVGANLRL